MKLRKQTLGPTPNGLYAGIPKGAVWTDDADPAGGPEDFLPGAGSYVFDIAEWRWNETLWIEASINSAGNLAGFGLVFGLSDGGKTDYAELWKDGGRRGPILQERQEWTIPRSHPTRELVLVLHGERTTQVLRKLEQCFGYEAFAHPALPDKTAMICEVVILRAPVIPEEGRFTAQMKVILPEHNGWPYGEFFLNVNSVRKQLWLSEKSAQYRSAILTRISHHAATS